jgi:hypothetical protein
MKVFELYSPSDPLNYPEYISTIRNYLDNVGIFPKAISDKRLEILWYAFSERYDACFLIPDEDYFLPEFAEWLSKMEYEDAICMDVYGNIKRSEE